MQNRLTVVPNLHELLARHCDPVMRDVAEVASDFLKEKLSGPGSGIQHPNLPNPSSLPGEYPAEQSGDLLACIGFEQVAPGVYEVGALNSVAPVPVEAWALEYPQPPDSPVDRSTAHGARPWISKAAGDEELHDRLRATAQQAR